jgi:hypothetical protein
MSITRRLHDEAMERLKQARCAAQRFIACSGGDWTAKVQIETGFDYLEEDLREFARGHYGIGVKAHRPGQA